MNPRSLAGPLLALAFFATAACASAAERLPNIVVIFADDLGYADIGPYGAKVATPNLDRLAREGTKYTHARVSQAVCSASRAALLTGCYSNRIGIHGALGPNANYGIAASETTLPELLKTRGYATGMAGKWHLGHREPFLPNRHGFDESFGLPYSNDMWPQHPEAKKGTYPSLPLIENGRTIDEEVTAEEQSTLTTRYTERAVSFIERNKGQPFFFYLAHSMPHVPLFVSEKFKGKSGHGLYGDVIQEIDWSVGEVLRALERHGLERDTIVVFTSDNGPWLSYGDHAGSAGALREGKGTMWEGGIRVPFLMRWPGKLAAGKTNAATFMTIDLLPTLAGLVKAELPRHAIDGRDIWPLLSGAPGAKNPQTGYGLWYAQNELQGVLSGDGRWKLMLPHRYRTLPSTGGGKDGIPVRYENRTLDAPQLYDLQADPGETRDVSGEYPEDAKRLLAFAETCRAQLGDALTKRTGSDARPAGKLP